MTLTPTRTLAPQTLDDARELVFYFQILLTSWQWHPWVHGLFRNKRWSHKTWNWIVTSVHKLKRCFCVGQDGQSSATGYFQYLCLLSRLRLLTCRIFFVFISSTPIVLYVLPLLWFYFCIYLFKPLLCCIFYWQNHSYNDKTVPPCLWFESNIRDMYKYSLLSSLSVTFYPCCLEPISKMWDSNQTLNVISLLSGALAASDNWGSLRQNLLNWSAPLDNNTNNLISSSFDIFRCANISNTYPSQPSVSR